MANHSNLQQMYITHKSRLIVKLYECSVSLLECYYKFVKTVLDVLFNCCYCFLSKLVPWQRLSAVHVDVNVMRGINGGQKQTGKRVILWINLIFSI